ncbi:MAG: hypothetical protein GY716_04510 [bacterium]|nr:hypothetical protein [bacterium]
MALPDWIATFVEPLDRLGIVYMITGSVGAMAYGEPRMTTDVDIVLRLAPDGVRPLLDCFPETEFYHPPEEVVRHEVERAARGHFNVIQHATGMKADFYPAGRDRLMTTGLERSQRLDIGGTTILLAPPEYVIVRKLEFHREGGSDKHLRDIASMLASGSTLDLGWLEGELDARGLTAAWRRLRDEGRSGSP